MREPLRFDHYRVLGIERNASTLQVKQAYRALVKRCHPDRNGSPEAIALFHAVHAAYETLSQPHRRRAYDEALLHYRHVAPATTVPRTVRRDPVEADLPVNRFAFVGLHFTGLCFGATLIAGILVGIVFFQWPAYLIAFTLPGVVVIPDSLAGLRTK